MLKLKLQEREAIKGGPGNKKSSDGKKDGDGSKGDVITSDYITGEGNSDSAIGAGISIYTRSSRASQSDFEFSESYL